jgi:hypothetical protein
MSRLRVEVRYPLLKMESTLFAGGSDGFADKSGQAPEKTPTRVEGGAERLHPAPRPRGFTGRDARVARRRDACATLSEGQGVAAGTMAQKLVGWLSQPSTTLPRWSQG